MTWTRHLLGKPGAVAGVCLAAALLGMQAGPLLWTLLGHPPDDTLVTSAPTRTEPVDQGAGVLTFAAAEPFGAYTPPRAAQPELAETGLGLTLHGVVVAEPAARSRAFILADGTLGAYSPGDAVAADVRLVTVHPRFVILEVDGVRERLSLPDAETAGGVSPRDQAGASNVLARLSPSARATAGRAGGGTTERAAETPEGGAQAVIDAYRRRIEENPQAVLDSLALEATEQGYRIDSEPPEIVRRAGLQPGDVVTRVNGREVGDVQSDRQLYDRVAAEGRARVEIRRGERTVTLTFPLQ